MISPYLRAWMPKPCPRFLAGDRCLTSFGVGTVTRTYWHSIPNNEPHWRYVVVLENDDSVDCSHVIPAPQQADTQTKAA